MPYLPLKPIKGKHYKVYVESKEKLLPSKAHAIELALREALKDETHIEKIDYIPAYFVLQSHGWVKRENDPFKSAKKLKKFMKQQIKKGKDPIRVLEKKGMGKWHYDLRIWKLSAPSWFGFTYFSAPWKGTPEKKTQGTAKGVQVITEVGRKLTKWLQEKAFKGKGERFKERLDRLYWMKVDEGYWPPGSKANPTKKEWAYMIKIDSGPAVIHRREIDFTDVTFLGKLLNGRYYNRLVERKLKPDELPKTYKLKRPTGVFFYMWKAKHQFDPKLMLKVAKGEIELSPLEKTDSAKKKKK